MKNPVIPLFLAGAIILITIVGNAYRMEKSKPAVKSCQVEIDDLNYQLNQCKMIRGE